MISINRITLLGRVGKDAKLSYTQNGTAVAEFSVATSYRKGEQEFTTWHNCKAWSKLAEILGDTIKKGDVVWLEGSQEHRKWEGKDGKSRISSEVNIDTARVCVTGNTRAKNADQIGLPSMSNDELTEEQVPF